MGSFRFFLAIMVAFSHWHGRYLPVNLGASAVICFYFISGYLMTLSYQRFQKDSATPLRAFYTDRFVRLYPAFLLVFALSCLWLLFDPNRAGQLANGTWFYELLIIPYNYIFAMDATRSDVIVPGWSLGAEIQFYLVLPLIMLLSLRTKIVALMVLVLLQWTIFAMGGTVADHLPGCGTISEFWCNQPFPTAFGYVLPQVVVLTFLLGHLAYVGEHQPLARTAVRWTVAAYAVAFFVILSHNGMLKTQPVDEVLIGMMLFVPLARELLKRIKGGNSDWLDGWMGKLAYPVFLTHMLARWIVEATNGTGGAYYLWCALVTLLLAIGVAQFQARIDSWRYRLRGFGKVTAKA